MEPLLVQQCKFLEQVYGSNLTNTMLQQQGNDELISLRSIKDTLLKADYNHIWDKVSSRDSLTLLSRDVHWLKLWDVVREYGIQGVRSIISVLRAITAPVFSDDYTCNLCCFVYSKGTPPATHLAEIHLQCNLQHLLDLLKDPCEETFDVAASLKSLFVNKRMTSNILVA